MITFDFRNYEMHIPSASLGCTFLSTSFLVLQIRKDKRDTLGITCHVTPLKTYVVVLDGSNKGS